MTQVIRKADFRQILSNANAVVEGGIFVYKSGFIGTAYVNKEALASLGASLLNGCLRGMTRNSNVAFSDSVKKVAVIGPSYGAISYAPVVAEYLENCFPDITFMPARTQLDSHGKHYIPDKLLATYEEADTWIIVEDIVNQGSTISQVGDIIRTQFGKEIHTAMCLVDRGGKVTTELKVDQFSPFIQVDMAAFDPRIDASLFDSGLDINTKLGKGAQWVKEFGYPPYAPGTDFSSFSLFE